MTEVGPILAVSLLIIDGSKLVAIDALSLRLLATGGTELVLGLKLMPILAPLHGYTPQKM